MSTVLAHRQQVLGSADLLVVREGIRFRDVSPGRVRIEIEVRNLGTRASEPTHLRLESAPLGAFVSWSPLERLPVSPIPPGGVCVVTLDVERPQVAPLGDFGSVPPGLLVAAATPEEEPRGLSQLEGRMLNLVRRSRRLAPDVFELLARRNAHWAGNLNVFVGSQSVERHAAKSLRIHPGRLNLANFLVGSRGEDAYAFELRGTEGAWDASLTITRSLRRWARIHHIDEIVLGAWIEAKNCFPVTLALEPLQDCAGGKVDVHVRQRSSGKEAVVEFSLDPQADGPGCYAV